MLFLSVTIGTYAQFKGASKRAYRFLETVSGVGTIVLLAAFVCNFFIMEWWLALIYIVVYLVFVPTIAMAIARIPFVGLFTSILTIIEGVFYVSELLYNLKI